MLALRHLLQPPGVVVLLAFAACLPIAQDASAQGLGMISGGSDPGAATLVAREDVTTAAEASFLEALVARGERAVDDAVPGFDLGPHVVDAQRRYERALSAELDELHADGVLTLAETMDALPPVRKRELDRFVDAIEARSAGFAPPPRQDDHDGLWSFVVAMARYVTLERNGSDDWLRLLAWIGGGLVAAAILSSALTAIAKRADDSDHQGFYRSVTAIRLPLLLAAAAAGALIGLDAIWKPNAVATVVRSGLLTLILLLLFWACWNLCTPVSAWIASVARRVSVADIGDTGHLVVTRMLRLVLIVVFVLVATKFVLGASLTGILAGLGVAGVVLWFLLQGLIENLAASFTLFGDRSISVGDTVIYKGQWGTVEDIGFRTTRFRTFDGHLITIPNSNLISDAVENVSRRPSIRRRFQLGIDYDTPPNKVADAADIVRSAIASRGDRIDGGEDNIHVVFQTFGGSSLDLLVQYFAATTDYWEAESLHQQINLEILERFAEAGIGIPFPTQTTILRAEHEDGLHLQVDGLPERNESLDGAQSTGA